MTENDTPERGWKRYQNIALAAAAAIVAGVAIGWAIAGTGGSTTSTTVAVVAPSTTGPTGPTTTTLATTPNTDVPGQISLPAVEDTYTNQEQPEDINGLEELIEVESDAPEIKQGLVRFQVAGIPEGETIRSAVLRLFVIDEGEDAITVHLVNGEWTQSTTTGTNAPAVGEQVGSIPNAGPEGQYIEVDLTSAVTAPGTYDFYLVPTGGDTAEFAAIENGANPPTLVVRWVEGPAQGTTTTTVVTAETQPLPLLDGEPAVLVGAGDIADCGEDAARTGDLLDQIVAEHPQAVIFTAGDNAYGEGTQQQFADCYQTTWGEHKDRTRPSPGNHDYDTGDAAGYFGYFGSAAGPASDGYYSYELGAWQIFSLNSNCDDIGGCEASSPQGQWLADELAASDALCTAAYWHHPLFSSGEHGGDDDVRDLFRLLYEDGAELVLVGHDHNYERFAPQDHTGAADPDTGIRQIVVGTGGRSLRDFPTVAANSEVRDSTSFGVLELTLFENGYEWEFIPAEADGFTDEGAGACH